MEETILDKVGADGTLQPLENFTAQMVNYFNGVQKVLDDNEQLRQQVAVAC